TNGSGATATTSMSSWLLMISVIRPRTRAESSTHRTRIFFIIASTSGLRTHAFVHRLSAQAELAADVREILGMTGKQQAARLQKRHEALLGACLSRFIELRHLAAAKERVEVLGHRPGSR